MATPGNPLLGSWPSTAGVNQNPYGVPPPPPGPAGTPGSQDPYGRGARGSGNLGYNLAETNLQTGLQKNALIPLFSKMMFGAGGDASQFFKQLMDLGSPFYKQKQQKTAEQGAKAGQDEAGLARQRLQASGAGYGPSGAGAAMFGGMGQAQAGNQEEAFLNNLFQNELLQAQGAQGLSSIAGLFNPAQLATSQINPQIQQPTGGFADSFAKIVGALFPKGATPSGSMGIG